jgi:TonB family protein
MRRAIVISVLFHLLVVVSLLELPVWPMGSQRAARGSSPLVIDFRFGEAIGQRTAAVRNRLPVDDVPPVSAPARMTKPLSPVALKRPVGKSAGGEPSEGQLSASVDVADNLAPLAADLEREYRINLAREVRRSQYYPAEILAKRQEGLVRMSIAYWGQAGRPSVSLEQSSGFRELDQEALKAVALAISRVPLPAGVQGISFRMPYVLEYRLAE